MRLFSLDFWCFKPKHLSIYMGVVLLFGLLVLYNTLHTLIPRFICIISGWHRFFFSPCSIVHSVTDQDLLVRIWTAFTSYACCSLWNWWGHCFSWIGPHSSMVKVQLLREKKKGKTFRLEAFWHARIPIRVWLLEQGMVDPKASQHHCRRHTKAAYPGYTAESLSVISRNDANEAADWLPIWDRLWAAKYSALAIETHVQGWMRPTSSKNILNEFLLSHGGLSLAFYSRQTQLHLASERGNDKLRTICIRLQSVQQKHEQSLQLVKNLWWMWKESKD